MLCSLDRGASRGPWACGSGPSSLAASMAVPDWTEPGTSSTRKMDPGVGTSRGPNDCSPVRRDHSGVLPIVFSQGLNTPRQSTKPPSSGNQRFPVSTARVEFRNNRNSTRAVLTTTQIFLSPISLVAGLAPLRIPKIPGLRLRDVFLPISMAIIFAELIVLLKSIATRIRTEEKRRQRSETEFHAFRRGGACNKVKQYFPCKGSP